jgi:outer membrane cobalamin receptor
VDLQFRAENLLDQDYEEMFGFVAPGRTILIGARMNFGG